MRRLFLALLFTALASQAWGADIYVDNENAIDNGCTQAATNYNPATRTCQAGGGAWSKTVYIGTIGVTPNYSDAMSSAFTASSAGDTLYLMPNPTIDYVAVYTDAKSGSSIYGYSQNPNDTFVSISNDGKTNNRWFDLAAKNDFTVKYLAIRNGYEDSFWIFNVSSTTTGLIIDHCDLSDVRGIVNLANKVSATGTTDLTFTNNKIKGGFVAPGTGTFSIKVGNYNAATIEYDIFEQGVGSTATAYWIYNLGSTDNVSILNNILVGAAVGGIYSTSATSGGTIRNNIILGNGSFGSIGSGFQVRETGSSTGYTTSNNLSLPTMDETTAEFIGETNTNGISNWPLFTTYGRKGILTFTVDDPAEYASAQWLAAAVASYGWHMGWAIYQSAYIPATHGPVIKALVDAGHDIVSHGYSHTAKTSAGLPAFTVTHATATMSISGDRIGDSSTWDRVLTLSTGESFNLLTDTDNTCGASTHLNLTNIDGLRTCIGALSGYSVGEIGSTSKSVTLEDLTDQSLSGGYALKSTLAEMQQVEITEHYSWLENTVRTACEGTCDAWSPTAYVATGGYTDNGVMDVQLAAGFKIAGGTSTVVNGWNLNSLQIFDVKRITDTHLTDSQILVENEAKGILNHLVINGGMVDVNLHGIVDASPGTGQMTKADVLTFMGYVNTLSGGFSVIGSLAEADDYIEANGDGTDVADGSDARWSMTSTYTASDYRLLSSSPAINAGVDVGLTSDYRGMTVPQGSAPDIGAYEFGPGDPGFLKGTYRGTMGIHWMW
jgi:hypothetical protein